MNTASKTTKFLVAFTAVLFVVHVFQTPSKASPGCMDNSYHAQRYRAAYDYKNYHRVACNCPCERYVRLLARGQCRRCLHYHVPREPKLKPRS